MYLINKIVQLKHTTFYIKLHNLNNLRHEVFMEKTTYIHLIVIFVFLMSGALGQIFVTYISYAQAFEIS